MRSVLLCIDASYQIYRACASHSSLADRHDRFTGGLYGFLQSFGKMVRETEASHVVMCRDSKPYLRSREYPAYKQLRKKSKDDDLYQLYLETEPMVLDLLREMGVPIWEVAGFEADDLAAYAVTRLRRSAFDQIISASNDSDLYQLLDAPHYAVYSDSLANLMTRSKLLKKTGLTPSEFMLATALQGTHNDIEGIPRVGEKTAFRAVKDPALLRKLRDGYGPVIDRNLGLIKLPHPEMPRCELPRSAAIFNRQRLYRWLADYDIDVTLSMVSAFEQLERQGR